MPNDAAGTVAGIWRYPVKSMQGEALPTAVLTDMGILGDRVYALIDIATGKVVSAKNPRKWPHLLEWRAGFVSPPAAGMPPPPVHVTLPNGSSVASTAAEFPTMVSSIFGRRVTLSSTFVESPVLEEYWPDMDGLAHRETVTDEAMSGGTTAHSFFDYAPIHVLTTSTLAALSQAYPEGNFDPRRFRPNLLVETAGDGTVENDWVGRQIAIGDEVLLEGVMPCARCVMITLPQAGLPHDPGILKTAARLNNVNVGLYAKVLRSGEVRPGDPVRLATHTVYASL